MSTITRVAEQIIRDKYRIMSRYAQRERESLASLETIKAEVSASGGRAVWSAKDTLLVSQIGRRRFSERLKEICGKPREDELRLKAHAEGITIERGGRLQAYETRPAFNVVTNIYHDLPQVRHLVTQFLNESYLRNLRATIAPSVEIEASVPEGVEVHTNDIMTPFGP